MSTKLDEVFGVSTGPLKSYISREHVDDRFVEALESDKQVVVYGASKQGKTALVSKYLPYDKHVVVALTPGTQVVDIYAAMLRRLGIRLKTAEASTAKSETKVSFGTRVKAFVPFLGGGEAEAGGEVAAGSGKEEHYEEVPINLELPADVASLLERRKARTIVILENFHYLDDERQQALAFDLRAFQELNVQFIVLGVWREKNRLAQFNGDLLDRVIEVPVEPWKMKEFERVAQTGAEHLNIRIAPEVVEACSHASFSSIGVFQELLKHICLGAGVEEAVAGNAKTIGDLSLVDDAVSAKAQDYAARHQRALESIAAGNLSSGMKDGKTPLFLPYYLVKVLLDAGYEGVATGLKRKEIHERIQAMHHRAEDVRGSDMSNLLHNLAKTQANKKVSPPIVDYDRSSKRLQVVDSTFYFFLKHARLDEISAEIPSPLEGMRSADD